MTAEPSAGLPERSLSRTPEETIETAARLASRQRGCRAFYLEGDLGAGKTVFAKGLARHYGVDPRQVASPTFALVRRHGEGTRPLYHLDLYRIERPEELEELGIEEMEEEGAVLIVEWPDRPRTVSPVGRDPGPARPGGRRPAADRGRQGRLRGAIRGRTREGIRGVNGAGAPFRALPGALLGLALAGGLGAALSGSGCRRGSPPPGERANLLLVTVSSLRADHLGIYGYARNITPRLDLFGASGAVFPPGGHPLARDRTCGGGGAHRTGPGPDHRRPAGAAPRTGGPRRNAPEPRLPRAGGGGPSGARRRTRFRPGLRRVPRALEPPGPRGDRRGGLVRPHHALRRHRRRTALPLAPFLGPGAAPRARGGGPRRDSRRWRHPGSAPLPVGRRAGGGGRRRRRLRTGGGPL